MPLLAIAASGGADSIALMVEAAERFNPGQVTVLSVDHRTRPAAATERGHVAYLANRFGFAFAELCIGPVSPNQAAWRAARLQTLIAYCEERGIERLWLGHHKDDAIETSALRLLANGNLASLAGISAVRRMGDVWIERPLLARSSRAVRRHLMAQGLAWHEDPSNRDDRYRRVAVRRLLTAGGRTEAASLVRRTGLWREQREQLLSDTWTLAACRGPAGQVWLAPAALRGLPSGLAAAILRKAALSVAGREQRVRKVDFAAVLRSSGPPWQLGGTKIWAVAGKWLIGRDYRHIRDQTPLIAGEEVQWDSRFRLRLRGEPGPGEWGVARVGLDAARRLRLDLPAAWAAASLGIWWGETLAAAPELDYWSGQCAPMLQATLTWNRIDRSDSGLFRVAPSPEAPILRQWQRSGIQHPHKARELQR